MAERMVRLENAGGVYILTLDKPPVNAIDLPLLSDAAEVLGQVIADTSARALVVTGAGNTFSAGLDLRSVVAYGPTELRGTVNAINEIVTALYSLPLPTVAAINGHAIAGGFILAISCDYRVCADSAIKVGVTEVRAGVPFPVATIEVLRAELSPTVARWLTLVGRNISPSDALAYGIIDELVPADRVLSRALEVAGGLAEMPRESFQRIKLQLRGGTVERIRSIIDTTGDPLLKEWITDETKQAAPRLLAEEKSTDKRRTRS